MASTLRISTFLVGCTMLFVFFSYLVQIICYRRSYSFDLAAKVNLVAQQSGQSPSGKVSTVGGCALNLHHSNKTGDLQPPGCLPANDLVDGGGYKSIPPPLPGWKKVPTVERLTERLESGYLWEHGMCDCSRTLVHDVQWPWGLGSQVEVMLASLELALETNRTFVVSDRFLTQYTCSRDEEAGAASCFLPGHVGPCYGCDRHTLADLRAHPDRLPSATDPSSDKAPHVRVSDSTGRGPSKAGLRMGRYDRDAVAALALSRLWVLTADASAAVADRLAGMVLRRPICALHVRRGDAAGDGRRAAPLADYLRVLEDMAAGCRTLYLMTDDVPRVMSELEAARVEAGGSAMAAAKVVTMPDSAAGLSAAGWRQQAMAGAPASTRRDVTLSLLAEVEVMRSADWFVGDPSSNMARLIARLRIVSGWPRDTAGSVGWGGF